MSRTIAALYIQLLVPPTLPEMGVLTAISYSNSDQQQRHRHSNGQQTCLRLIDDATCPLSKWTCSCRCMNNARRAVGCSLSCDRDCLAHAASVQGRRSAPAARWCNLSAAHTTTPRHAILFTDSRIFTIGWSTFLERLLHLQQMLWYCSLHDKKGIWPVKTYIHNHFMTLSPGLPGWASARRNLFLDFMVQGKITEANTPTIWLGATPCGLISDPPASSPKIYARCPLCHNLPTLSWLGTGTKYTGLHGQWRGLACKNLNLWCLEVDFRTANVSKRFMYALLCIFHHKYFMTCSKW